MFEPHAKVTAKKKEPDGGKKKANQANPSFRENRSMSTNHL